MLKEAFHNLVYITIRDRSIAYKQNRQGAKQAVAQLTQDLHTALEGMII